MMWGGKQYNLRIWSNLWLLNMSVIPNMKRVSYLFNPLTPELNPSAQRCLTRFFTGNFASWGVHFFSICVKNQQMQQLFIQFINYVWYFLHVSTIHCHPQVAFLVPSERCSIEEQSIEYHPAGFEPTVPASERPHSHVLNRAATGISKTQNYYPQNEIWNYQRRNFLSAEQQMLFEYS
jgi:hypothetical protein